VHRLTRSLIPQITSAKSSSIWASHIQAWPDSCLWLSFAVKKRPFPVSASAAPDEASQLVETDHRKGMAPLYLADSERSLWEPHVETLGVFACYYLLCEGDNSGFNLNEDHV